VEDNVILVKTILQKTGNQIWSVDPDMLVFDALKMMAEKNIGALMVLSNNRLDGIFSERDYARKIVLLGKSSHETAVRDIMTRDVISVGPDQSIEECMALMTSKHIRHLPVLEGQKILGMVSIRDIVRELISEKEYTIKQLENYITGAR
jgi:CBS domain-containing protein